MRSLFSFPNPVNEVSARLVAGAVAITAVVILVFQLPVLLAPLAYGFIARALTGPTLSPLGQLVTRVVTPSLPFAAKPVPGPPKRFAQGMGAVMSTTGAVLYFAFHVTLAAYLFAGAIAVAATLESVFAICIGCHIFNMLMRAGVIPESVCRECLDFRARVKQTA